MDGQASWHGRIKPPVPTFVTADDVLPKVLELSGEVGDWTVWGDRVEPYLSNVSERAMKEFVNAGHAKGQNDLYGMNDAADTYEGEQ
jgi:hypothetical protein